jgi:hypothetical protein
MLTISVELRRMVTYHHVFLLRHPEGGVAPSAGIENPEHQYLESKLPLHTFEDGSAALCTNSFDQRLTHGRVPRQTIKLIVISRMKDG